MSISVEFPNEQTAQRVMYLLFRDLARVEGSIVLAKERLDPNGMLHTASGSQRRSAVQTLDSAPEQAQVIRDAYSAMQAGMRDARKRGVIS